jgi:hypothetical protein
VAPLGGSSAIDHPFLLCHATLRDETGVHDLSMLQGSWSMGWYAHAPGVSAWLPMSAAAGGGGFQTPGAAPAAGGRTAPLLLAAPRPQHAGQPTMLQMASGSGGSAAYCARLPTAATGPEGAAEGPSSASSVVSSSTSIQHPTPSASQQASSTSLRERSGGGGGGEEQGADPIITCPMLVGTLTSVGENLAGPDGTAGVYFVFPDLSVRLEGRFCLAFALFEIGRPSSPPAGAEGVAAGAARRAGKPATERRVPTHVSPLFQSLESHCSDGSEGGLFAGGGAHTGATRAQGAGSAASAAAQTLLSRPLTVYSSKKFPGMLPPTALSEAVGHAGRRKYRVERQY